MLRDAGGKSKKELTRLSINFENEGCLYWQTTNADRVTDRRPRVLVYHPTMEITK
jgi:hypothetical protein